MAEGFLRKYGGDRVEAHSAGLIAAGVHPRAVAVMKEAGTDISGQQSKTIDHALLCQMDAVITVCDNAKASCPSLPPHIKRIHSPIRDPVGLVGTEDEIMREFRRARDEIETLIKKVLSELL
jgi:arsenate reductase